MPTYQTINTPNQQGVPGLPAYLIGSYDYSQANVRFLITNVALTGNVATITGSVTAGNIPLVVGQLISVLCSNSIFNVSQVAITASTIDATTGVGTISYPVTHADVSSVPATGRATLLVPEIGEALAAMTSAPLSIQENVGPDNGRDITFVVTMTGTPTATVSVESALVNIDSQYTTVTAVSTNLNFTGTATTKSVIVADLNARYVRFRLASTSGSGSPTVVAKVLV